MAKSSPPLARRAFTLIEMLVVIAAVSVLFALMVPAFSSAFERAKVTKDLSNLRQIGAATQLYMNDNNGAFPGSATVTWMSQLNPKYLSSWRVLESPFDRRLSSEAGAGSPVSPISYGINSNVYSGGGAISADKITKPVTFIVFAPAQDNSATTVTFQGQATTSPPGVTLSGSSNTVTSNPGGVPVGGPHSNRVKINALCADWHADTMLWSATSPAFKNTSDPGNDADAQYRWCPQPPCP